MNPTPQEKYNRWVLAPLERIRSLPKGDGAFAALSICCGLYERFIRSTLKHNKVKATPEAFRKAAAVDLGCTEDAIDRFWNGYRLGMQHAFQPKTYIQDEGKGDRWGWEMAETEGFHHFPEIIQKAPTVFAVRIDPWKFVAHVLKRWDDNPELMNELSEFVLGDIAPIEQSKPSLHDGFSDPPKKEYKTYYDGESFPPGTGMNPGTGNS
jgi:hypothetical protein